MSGDWGLRHVFGAPHNSAGKRAGGFRTLASSKGLASQDVRRIETLVSGYNTPQGEGPRCRQLFKFPGRPAYALSTITPNGRMPDGRRGNFLAETIVVPETWLGAADWDVAAAFDAIVWSDPEAAALEAGAGENVELDLVRLPVLEAGPLDRLATLARDVPAALLVPLVRAIVHQCHGLGMVSVIESALEDADDRWQALERVVLLSPLLVPPALRLVRAEGGGRRLLHLRSRSPHERMAPRAEITGFLLLHVDDLELEETGILDLGSDASPSHPMWARGDRYAHWLADVIRQGRFDELEARYRERFDGRPEAWFAAAVPWPDGSSASDVEDAGGEARPPAEAASDDLPRRRLERLEEQVQELLSSNAQLEAAIQEAADPGRRGLGREAQGQLSEMRDSIENVHRDVAARFDALEGVQLRLEALERAIAGSARSEAGRRPSVQSAVTPTPPPKRTVSSRVAPAVATDRSRTAKKKGKPFRRWAVGLMFVGGVAFAALGGRFLGEHNRGGGPDLEPRGPSGTVLEPPSRQERRQTLVDELRDRAVTNRLLGTAIRNDAFAERTEVVSLMTTLGYRDVGDRVQAMLVQEAIGMPVDGRWGPASRRALRNRLDGCSQCLSSEPWATELGPTGAAATCLQHLRLGLIDGAQCDLSSPWERGRVWNEQEASRARDWITRARGALGRRAPRDLLPAIDPSTGLPQESLRSGAQLVPEHGEVLLDLAFAWMSADPDARVPGSLTNWQLQALEELVSTLRGT